MPEDFETAMMESRLRGDRAISSEFYHDEQLGLMVKNLTKAFAEQLGYEGLSGALIVDVQHDRIAAQAGLREGMLITRVGDKQVKNVAEFHGDHVDFEPSWSWPKPIQKPHPPIVLGGGAGPKTFGDIAEFCDGWMPISGRHEFTSKVDALHDAVRSVGRDPASISLGVFGARSTPDGDALRSLGGGFINPACSIRIRLHLERLRKRAPGLVAFHHGLDILRRQRVAFDRCGVMCLK